MKVLPKLILLCLMVSCTGPVLIRERYHKTETENPDCNLTIVKSGKYVGAMQPIGRLKVKDYGISIRCSEKEVLEIVKEEGCRIGALVAHLVNIRKPSIWGSSCFRTDVDFYTDSIENFAGIDSNFFQFDSIANKGLRLGFLGGGGNILGGSQADHGVYFYNLETGEGIDSVTSYGGIGGNVGYFINEQFGLSFIYQYRFVSTGPAKGSKPENRVKLHQNQYFSLCPEFVFLSKDSHMGKFSLQGFAGGSIVLLKLEDQFKDLLKTNAMVSPYESYATGPGWLIGIEPMLITHIGMVWSFRVQLDSENVKFKGATASLDAKNLSFQFGLGYKLKPTP